MRLFVAINFSGETRAQVADLCRRLSGVVEAPRFTRPGSLHLTLAFLGEQPEAALDDLYAALDSLPETSAFPLALSGLGRFESGGGSTLWLGVEASPRLTALHKSLASALRQGGFTLEHRTFRPHITLARQARVNWPGALAAAQDFRVSETAEALTLFRSDRGRGGMAYTPLYVRAI